MQHVPSHGVWGGDAIVMFCPMDQNMQLWQMKLGIITLGHAFDFLV